MTAITYCSSLELFDYMGLTKQVPDYDNGSTSLETVSGSTATQYVLAHNRVIGGTETLTAGTATLVDVTDYSLNDDTGVITLTSAGKAVIGSNQLYAAYKYNQFYKDSAITEIITSMTSLMDSMLFKTFQTSSIQFMEEHTGKGAYYRMYSPNVRPSIFAKTYLTSDLDSTTAILYVKDTTRFNANDYITCEGEVMKVTTVNSTTQLTVTRATTDFPNNVASAHAANVFLCNVVVEISNSPLGYTPLWHIQRFNYNYDIDSDTENVQLLHINAEDKDALASDLYPPQRIFNRMRMTYRGGANSVPADIKKLCILLSARQMYSSMVLNALSRGTNGFESQQGFQLIDNEIKLLTRQNRRLMMDGF